MDIILADDHPVFRNGVKLLLESIPEFNLVAEAGNGHDLIKKCESLNPDIVILDLRMPGLNGIEATKLLTFKFPRIRIIILSMVEIVTTIFEVISAGAKAYVLKNSNEEEIVKAIYAVQKNNVYYCTCTQELLSGFIQHNFNHGDKKNQSVLSKLDISIIKLICKELSNKEISDELFLSVRTIEWHRSKIMEKLKVKSTIGVVVYALENKLYCNEKNNTELLGLQ